MGAEEATDEKSVTCPRPGHADLTGGMKYNHHDMRNVLERASARETAARVAVGALTAQVLEPFGVEFKRRVVRIGEVEDKSTVFDDEFYDRVKSSPVGFGDSDSEKECCDYIDSIKEAGESVGGIVEITVKNLPPGLGSYVHYDRKLDANLAFSLMSVQAIKAVEIGMGFDTANTCGSKVHDEIVFDNEYKRLTNNAGGIEGGMSNGEPIVVRAAMKPIPTLYNPLRTVDILNHQEKLATVERSDVCAVPACSVVAQAAVQFEITKAFLEKFGNDTLEDIKAHYSSYTERIKKF